VRENKEKKEICYKKKLIKTRQDVILGVLRSGINGPWFRDLGDNEGLLQRGLIPPVSDAFFSQFILFPEVDNKNGKEVGEKVEGKKGKEEKITRFTPKSQIQALYRDRYDPMYLSNEQEYIIHSLLEDGIQGFEKGKRVKKLDQKIGPKSNEKNSKKSNLNFDPNNFPLISLNPSSVSLNDNNTEALADSFAVSPLPGLPSPSLSSNKDSFVQNYHKKIDKKSGEQNGEFSDDNNISTFQQKIEFPQSSPKESSEQERYRLDILRNVFDLYQNDISLHNNFIYKKIKTICKDISF